jgi:hypothetical protein
MRHGKVCDWVRGLFAQPSLNRNPVIGCRQMSGRAMGIGECDASLSACVGVMGASRCLGVSGLPIFDLCSSLTARMSVRSRGL